MKFTGRAPLRVFLTPDVPASSGTAVSRLALAITPPVTGSVSWPVSTSRLQTMRSGMERIVLEAHHEVGGRAGGAGAQLVLLTALVRTSTENTFDRHAIGAAAWQMGRALGTVKHPLDVYTSALGGIVCVTYGEPPQADRLIVSASAVHALMQRLVVVFDTDAGRADVQSPAYQPPAEAPLPVHDSSQNLRRDSIENLIDTIVGGDIDALASSVAGMSPSAHNPGDFTGRTGHLVEYGDCVPVAWDAESGATTLICAPGRRELVRARARDGGLAVLEFAVDTYGVLIRKG